jgi:hypothetical protein
MRLAALVVLVLWIPFALTLRVYLARRHAGVSRKGKRRAKRWPVPYQPPRNPSLPVAVNDHGQTVEWFWQSEATAHLLVTGRTGAGKSVLTAGLATGALLNDWEMVAVVDPKQAGDLVPLRSHKRVRYANTLPAITKLLETVEGVRESRSQAQTTSRARHEKAIPFRPILVIVDEVANLTAKVGASTPEGKRDDELRAKCSWLLDRLLSMGRSGGVHVVVGAQRPDAKFLSGPAKFNIGAKVLLGRPDDLAMRMVFGPGLELAEPTRRDRAGRGWIDVGRGPIEAQAFNVTLDDMVRELQLEPEVARIAVVKVPEVPAAKAVPPAKPPPPVVASAPKPEIIGDWSGM